MQEKRIIIFRFPFLFFSFSFSVFHFSFIISYSSSVASEGKNKNRDDRIRKDSSRSYCDTHCLQLKVLTRAIEVRSHLASMLKRFAPKGTPFASCGDDDVTLRKCLISGYFANAAKLASTGDYLTVRGNTSVSIHTHSVISRYVREYKTVFRTSVGGMHQKIPVTTLDNFQGIFLAEISASL